MTNGHMIVGSSAHESLEREKSTFCSLLLLYKDSFYIK